MQWTCHNVDRFRSNDIEAEAGSALLWKFDDAKANREHMQGWPTFRDVVAELSSLDVIKDGLVLICLAGKLEDTLGTQTDS